MFKEFKKAVAENIEKLSVNGLFLVDIDQDEFFELYLDSFPPGTNEMFRERREYDCSSCKHFIKQYGGLVGIIDGKMVSIWSLKELPETYQPVADAMSKYIHKKAISNIFFVSQQTGCDYNFEDDKKWSHFYYNFKDYIRSNVDQLKGEIRQNKETLVRSFEEITLDAAETVLDLVESKALYRGEEYARAVQSFITVQKEYNNAPNKNNYCWMLARTSGRGGLRNTAIGTLLINLSEGMDVETAVRKYEAVVAPANYKRPKAIFTKQMKENAQKTVLELGLGNSLGRVHAKLQDINIQNVLWATGDVANVMQNPFDVLDNQEVVKNMKLDHIEAIGMQQFVNEVLPGANKVEIMVDNSHKGNLMSLIAPENLEAPSLFKWDNGYSWTYNGEVADSMREAVKSHGGKVDGILRFSIMWSEDKSDNSDLDAHCKLPSGKLIYYGNKRHVPTQGILDVDIMNPIEYHNQGKAIVENITFPAHNKLLKGNYLFRVHGFSIENSKGFKAQIEMDGKVFDFTYPRGINPKSFIDVATVYWDGSNFTIKEHLKSSASSQEIWGINTMKFIPVQTVLQSPNYWGENNVGNRHFFFMLEGCKNPNDTRGFYNEFLKEDLNKHKKVFEALGSKLRVPYTDDQLSGVGFSSTMKNEVVIKVNNQIFKLKFSDEKFVPKSLVQEVQI